MDNQVPDIVSRGIALEPRQNNRIGLECVDRLERRGEEQRVVPDVGADVQRCSPSWQDRIYHVQETLFERPAGIDVVINVLTGLEFELQSAHSGMPKWLAPAVPQAIAERLRDHLHRMPE